MESVKARQNVYGLDEVSIVSVGKRYPLHNVLGSDQNIVYEVISDRGVKEKVHSSYFFPIFPSGNLQPDTEGAATKIKSDGGSTDYYRVYETDKDCQDIIERKGMNWNRGNVFKAAFRMGEKDGPDELYDWKKIKWFAEREIARLEGKDN